LSGAEVVLALSDGSELQLEEETSLDIAVLVEEADTGARTSRIKLLWGQVRAMLSPGHQKEGSSFDVETPNALVGVKFSQPVIEVGYDPETDTTTVDAQTVDVVVTNLKTQRIELIRKGQRGLVRDRSILLQDRDSPSGSPAEATQVPQQQPDSPEMQENMPPNGKRPKPGSFRRMRMSARQAVGSTVPISVGPVGARQPGVPGGIGGMPGGGMGTGLPPQPGIRPERPEEHQSRIIMIHIRE
jgi:hypothetical protein